MRWKLDKKKAAAAAGLTLAVLALGTGLFWYMGRSDRSGADIVQAETQEESESPVRVAEIETKAIVEKTKSPKETKSVSEESVTGTEQLEAELEEIVQTEAPVIKTAETAAVKIRTPEEATPPAETPTSENVAVPVENPNENGECQPEHTEAMEEQPQGGETNSAGAVYVPGFGYIEPSGTVEGENSYTDGDWDKIIGTME